MNDASKKIQKELEAYKKTVMAKKPEAIYQSSMNIIFTEGTAWYTKELAESSEKLAALILVDGKTLVECSQHVIQMRGFKNSTPEKAVLNFVEIWKKKVLEKAAA